MLKNLQILTLNKPGITDFAKERNNLLKKAKSKWVLFIDNDETMDRYQVSSIKYQVSRNLNVTSYKLLRKNFFLGQYVGTDKIVRLVKKGTGKFERSVHETWKSKISHPAGVIKTPVIIHNTADNLKGYLIKINNYSSLHAKENQKEGKKANLFKIIFFPMAKFIITLIKSKNVVFSIMQSLHSYLSWAKLYLQSY